MYQCKLALRSSYAALGKSDKGLGAKDAQLNQVIDKPLQR